MNLSVRIAEAERDRIGSAPPVIDVKSLTKTYDPKAGAVLDDVSLRVGKGLSMVSSAAQARAKAHWFVA